MFSGVALVGGDVSGGFTRVTFVPQNPTTTPSLDDQRRQYVWFLDGATVRDGPGDSGNFTLEVFTHWARANAALAVPAPFQTTIDMLPTASLNRPLRPPLPDVISRLPIFWDTQELAGVNNQIVTMTLQLNVDNNESEFSCYGRYYDRQILANRGFGRLVSPPAISQFD